MEKAEVAVLAALAPLTDDDKLALLSKVKANLGASMKIHISKLSGTTLGEWVVCREVLDRHGGKLVWNRSTPNGVDAIDSHGQGVEIKCTDISAGRASSNYKNPSQWVGETDAEYAKRICNHWGGAYPGGHYWVIMSDAYTKVNRVVFISGANFAVAMSRRLKTHKKNAHNFGAPWCTHCGAVHRFEEIAKEVESHQTIPVRTITSQCNK